MKKTIAAVIVNWNGKADTRICLESLQKVKIPKGFLIQIIVVDNGSTDNSVSYLRELFPDVTYIETGENLGFTGGNNKGIEYAASIESEYVWMLNNDTIVDTEFLSIIHAFDDPHVGAAGSKIYFAPDHEFHHDRYVSKERGRVIWYAGGKIDWANMYASHRGVDEVDVGQYDKAEDTDFITGCSIFIRTNLLTKIGGFDNLFYLYYEDLDLSMKITMQRFRIIYYPTSVLWHVNAGSSGKPGNPTQEYYITRNRMIIGMRYAPFRTKFALIRQALSLLLSGTTLQKKAIYDWIRNKNGKQYVPKK